MTSYFNYIWIFTRCIIFFIIISLIVYNYRNIEKYCGSFQHIHIWFEWRKWLNVQIAIHYIMQVYRTNYLYYTAVMHKYTNTLTSTLDSSQVKWLPHPCWLHGINKMHIQVKCFVHSSYFVFWSIEFDGKKAKHKSCIDSAGKRRDRIDWGVATNS